ncbi:type IV secretion protein Rhs [Flavivirga eckloniae]|uniref:Type IV secretion protein Rhs n=1 Tax=Flavivirga eckloniae TaxID=1803846 RepID=A0A2K9PPM3_9FLAO|nr:type IV secretion protein Rhs [Flavivirga eckloniae]
MLLLISQTALSQARETIIEKGDYTISAASGKVELKATQSIILKPNVWIKNGSTFTAEIVEHTTTTDSYTGVSLGSNQNYVFTRNFQAPMTSFKATTAREGDVVEQVTYFDGIGRPIQNIGIKSAPDKKDIITHIEYDAFGRQDKDWLSYHEITGSVGAYRGNRATATKQYYKDNYSNDFTEVTLPDINAYSQKNLEASPLNRVLKQAAPGKDWKLGGGKEIEFGYNTNTGTEVKQYGVSLIFANNIYAPTLTGGTTNYPAGSLFKTITKDENHDGTSSKAHTTEEFKNKQGQVVLKRTYVTSMVNGVSQTNIPHDTHYVYDDFGNLTYVIPPKVDTSDGISLTELSELCYQYKYDLRNRLVEKKIPGKGKEYIIYDKLDRPIMTQDANQRTNEEWLFTYYDAFGRVAYKGKCSLPDATNIDVQAYADQNSSVSVSKRETGILYNGTTLYYNMVPIYNQTRGSQILTINYYDNYTFDKVSGNPETSYDITPITNAKGLTTGSKVRVLGSNTWITTVTYYDNKSRPIYIYSFNDYLKTTDKAKNRINFAGQVTESTTTHVKTGQSTITAIDTFVYDHEGRLLRQKQTINDLGQETIVDNTYNNLGQLTIKGVGGKSSSTTRLQTVNYAYNVRGWLKQINDPAILGNDLFGVKIGYNEGANPLYNGNISSTQWRTANTDPSLKTYNYQYDALNRITNATDNSGHYNLINVLYDKNGNITNFTRTGHVVDNPVASNNTHFGTMDQLSYTYQTNSNKLLKVSDAAATDKYGFKDDAVDKASDISDDYTYDVNGNLLTDTNKGIISIEYNHLNLPTKVDFGFGRSIDYTYDATGIKILKRVNLPTAGGGTVTLYAGNYIYESQRNNTILKFFNHSEGYLEPKNQFDLSQGFDYVYQYKDHLGNIRLSYKDSNDNGSVASSEILEENNYYPFGLKHKGYNNVVNGVEYKYKTYQGQEWHDELGLNLHEWKYRFSDPAIGRFISIDPLAEDYRYNGVYNFAENRVIDGNELEGLEWQPVNADGNNIAPNSDQIANYNWAGYDYSMARGVINTKGFVTEGITGFSMTAKEGTVASGAIQGNNSAGTEGATFFSVDNNKSPVKEFSALSSKSLSFTGSMETFPSNANKEWASGDVTLTSSYANGKTLTDKSWTAISGPWGNGSLENGDYTTNNLRDNRTGSYANHGVGFTFDVNPTFTTSRDLLRFHPDGGTAGTLGCIGLTCGATGLRDFRTRVNNYLSNNTSINVNVNITNNPNNDGN